MTQFVPSDQGSYEVVEAVALVVDASVTVRLRLGVGAVASARLNFVVINI